VNFYDRSKIVDAKYGFETITPYVEFTTNGTESTVDTLNLNYAGLAVFCITLITPAIGVISMVFGLSFGIAFDFITTMQLLSLFPIARLYLPTSLMQMFRWF